MKSNPENFTKKDYVSPKLICYGDIRQLTQGGAPRTDLDTGVLPPQASRSATPLNPNIPIPL